MKLGIFFQKNKITFVVIKKHPIEEIWSKEIVVKEETISTDLLLIFKELFLKNKIYFKNIEKIGIIISNDLLEIKANFYIKQELKQYLEQQVNAKVVFNNQANCFAWAVSYLEFPQTELVAGVVLDTSFEGAVIQNKDKQRFNLSSTGNWGHYTINHQGKKCCCGRNGCLKQYLADSAAKDFQSSKVSSIYEIYQLSLQNNLEANQFMKNYLYYFGLAISTIVNIYDPEIIVLFGKNAKIASLYTDGILEAKKYFRSLATKITYSKLDCKSVGWGSAFLS